MSQLLTYADLFIRGEYFEERSASAEVAKGIRTTVKIPEKLYRRAKEKKVITEWMFLKITPASHVREASKPVTAAYQRDSYDAGPVLRSQRLQN